MKAGKYLSRVQELYLRIEAISRTIQRIDILMATAGISNYSAEGRGRINRESLIEKQYIKKERYEKKLEALCVEGIGLISDITDKLQLLEPIHETLLSMRYIECMAVEDICEELHYTKGYVYNQISIGLSAFQKKFLQNKRCEKK